MGSYNVKVDSSDIIFNDPSINSFTDYLTLTDISTFDFEGNTYVALDSLTPSYCLNSANLIPDYNYQGEYAGEMYDRYNWTEESYHAKLGLNSTYVRSPYGSIYDYTLILPGSIPHFNKKLITCTNTASNIAITRTAT